MLRRQPRCSIIGLISVNAWILLNSNRSRIDRVLIRGLFCDIQFALHFVLQGQNSCKGGSTVPKRQTGTARVKLFQLIYLCRHFLQGVPRGALEDQNLHLVLCVCTMR